MLNLARGVVIVGALALVTAPQSPAQDWTNVKALPVGAKVQVKVNSRTVRGEIDSVTDASLTVNSGNGQEVLAQQVILRVSVNTKSHRRRNALIGLGTGAALGLVIGGAGGCSDFGGSRTSPAAYTACVISLGAIGTLVGLVIPAGGWREVYKK